MVLEIEVFNSHPRLSCPCTWVFSASPLTPLHACPPPSAPILPLKAHLVLLRTLVLEVLDFHLAQLND